MEGLALCGGAFEVDDGVVGAGDGHNLVLTHLDGFLGVVNERGDVRTEEVLVLAQANDQRGVTTGCHNAVRVVCVHCQDGECTFEAVGCDAHCLGEVTGAELIVDACDGCCSYLGVGLRCELYAFGEQFEACYTRHMCQKLGLFTPQDAEVPASDQLLAIDLLQLMLNHEADYTNTFVRLTLDMDGQDGHNLDGHNLDGTEPLFSTEAFSAWKARWRARLDEQAQSRQEAAARMKSVNPFVIPRNALVEAALEAAEARDMQPFNALLSILQNPFDPESNIRAYQGVPKDSREYMTFCGT